MLLLIPYPLLSTPFLPQIVHLSPSFSKGASTTSYVVVTVSAGRSACLAGSFLKHLSYSTIFLLSPSTPAGSTLKPRVFSASRWPSGRTRRPSLPPVLCSSPSSVRRPSAKYHYRYHHHSISLCLRVNIAVPITRTPVIIIILTPFWHLRIAQTGDPTAYVRTGGETKNSSLFPSAGDYEQVR